MTAALMGKKVSAAACQESIAGEVLRFHVIANSDSSEDQELKLQVKDEMIEYMKVLLEGADTCLLYTSRYPLLYTEFL